jgi:small neutral amino acid transporter SnatA (MarC family)
MKMYISIIISSIICLIAFLYIADTTITFNPFSIHLAAWKSAVGWLIIAIGVGLISDQKRDEGIKKGVDGTIELLKEYSKNPDATEFKIETDSQEIKLTKTNE